MAKTFLITSHIRGDGDSFGSALALSRVLRHARKRAVTSIDSQVPDIYAFLPGVQDIRPPSRVRRDFDVAVTLDTPTPGRLGAVESLLSRCSTLINIDHHRTNTHFADINWVDIKASSVGEMVYKLIRALGFCLDRVSAENLYAAIVTDTGRFCYENTTPESLRMAADLMEGGLDFVHVTRQVYQSTTREVFALRALAMETIQFADKGLIATMTVTKRMFAKSGAHPINTQDFVDIPRSIKGVSVAVLFQEMEKAGWVRASLRSDLRLEADKVAAQFGGGGHARAAGCEIHGTIAQVRHRVLAAIRARMKRS